MVKLFYSIVSEVTGISFRTLLSFQNVLAYFRLVSSQWSPSVGLIIMVIRTFLIIMTLRILIAWLSLKGSQVEVKHDFTHIHVGSVYSSSMLRLFS